MPDGEHTIRLHTVRLLQRIFTLTNVEKLKFGSPPDTEVDMTTWRIYRTRLDYGDGYVVEADLARGPEWAAENHPVVGGTVWLDMPEMGVQGAAEVFAIDPCPEPQPGSGRLILSIFRHSKGRLGEMRLENSDDVIRVTALHPFWSEDRRDWIAAERLRSSERVSSATRFVAVGVYTPFHDGPAYNIEVDGDHCYRVGSCGILVHNQSLGAEFAAAAATGHKQGDHVFNAISKAMREFSDTLMPPCAWPAVAKALEREYPKAETPPFDLTVDKGPSPVGGDDNSKQYGEAVQRMRSGIAVFVNDASRGDAQGARRQHSSALKSAWSELVNVAFDADAARLVPASEQGLIAEGRETLSQIRLSVLQALNP